MSRKQLISLIASLCLVLGAGMLATVWLSRDRITAAVVPAPSWEQSGTGNRLHAGVGPAFPAALPGWRLVNEWNDTVRAFGTWTSLCGDTVCDPRFPATMNGCSNQRFLLRWRSNGSTPVEFGDGTVAADIGTVAEDQLPAAADAGWAELHGCGWPLWKTHKDPNGLVDITVRLQQWVPAA